MQLEMEHVIRPIPNQLGNKRWTRGRVVDTGTVDGSGCERFHDVVTVV